MLSRSQENQLSINPKTRSFNWWSKTSDHLTTPCHKNIRFAYSFPHLKPYSLNLTLVFTLQSCPPSCPLPDPLLLWLSGGPWQKDADWLDLRPRLLPHLKIMSHCLMGEHPQGQGPDVRRHTPGVKLVQNLKKKSFKGENKSCRWMSKRGLLMDLMNS